MPHRGARARAPGGRGLGVFGIDRQRGLVDPLGARHNRRASYSQSSATCIKNLRAERRFLAASAASESTAAMRSSAWRRLPISVMRSRAATSVGSSGTRHAKAFKAPRVVFQTLVAKGCDAPQELAAQMIGRRRLRGGSRAPAPDRGPRRGRRRPPRAPRRRGFAGCRSRAPARPRARLVVRHVEAQHLFEVAESPRRIVQLIEIDLAEAHLQRDGVGLR